ncbi:MAG TPA: hypothetical protein DGT23_15550 [Micromonosporaceae bacterium]|nr:hypothetical protein [Micromonosporaceae bacterium]
MTTQEPFDPLVDLAGMWTVELAEKYLPIPGVPAAKYECWDGRLYMAPYEGVQNSFGEAELITILHPGARAAGLFVCAAVNLMLGTAGRWIQPELTIIDGPLRGAWVPAEHCVLPIEFVSPESRRRDRIDKPMRCAELGIPWYMTVELEVERDFATVVLSKLADGAYRPTVLALAGQRFEMEEPFTASFDPSELLLR